MSCGCSGRKPLLGGKKNVKIVKKMKGGQETKGATGLPFQYYNAKAPTPASGTSSVSPNDFAVQNLAPYNKVGGKKKAKKSKKSKKMKGGQETASVSANDSAVQNLAPFNKVGGKKTGGERHFRVCKLNGKEVSIGGVSITNKGSPRDAAKKLLGSIAHEKGLKKMNKLKLKEKYVIQEYTQGSSKKMYGPYTGHYRKYTPAEIKKASTAGGKVKFTMEAVVKLSKSKNQNGGKKQKKTTSKKK